MNHRDSLKIYLKQARTTKKLLERTNLHGGNSDRIAEIELKIKKARKRLKCLG